MGDRGGGRFHPGRGHGQGRNERGRGNVWFRGREDPPQGSSNTGTGSGSGSEKWDAAVNAGKGRADRVVAGAAGGHGINSPKIGAGDQVPCSHCNNVGHFPARCPTIRCERCRKLGHISSICQTVLPWECVAAMCGFQKPIRGFFFMPDDSSVKQVKERASSVVISVIEGSVSAREIEYEFNAFFGEGWRCTARTIGPGQFTMRLPSQKEVDRAVYYGERMRMKTKEAILRLSPWTASVGAKAVMQKAWVKVGNIPLDKRTENNIYYAGSLVGVSLELDFSTLHKPEFVRVLIGCRDLDQMPNCAEGCLGGNFYDFFFEIDKVVVGGPPKEGRTMTVSDPSGIPSPKRPRNENAPSRTEEDSEEQVVGSQTGSVRNVRNYEMGQNTGTEEGESTEDSAEENELLIDKIARENESNRTIVDNPSNKWLVPCPILQPTGNNTQGEKTASSAGQLQCLDTVKWPPLIDVVDVSSESISPLLGSPEYVVQSPLSPVAEESVEEESVVEPRVSERNKTKANVNMMEKAAVYSRKRNLEGMHKKKELDVLQAGASKLLERSVKAVKLMRGDMRNGAQATSSGTVSIN